MNVSNGYRKYGFDAYGGKHLQKSDMDYWMNNPQRTDPGGICFELGEEVEDVEADFFELLPTLNELWILNPKCHIYMTDATVALFKKNNVLIRGKFGSSAEELARAYKLRFLHVDMELARAGDYYERGMDIITLCFYNDGSAYIHQDCKCQGISAGNTGGGEVRFNLPKDFYLDMSAEDIAGMCWGRCYKPILAKGVLSSLIKKAKSKKGFMIDYTSKGPGE